MEEENIIKYNPLTTSTEILKEIKSILTYEDNFDENCNCIPISLNENYISLYDVYNVTLNKSKKFKKTEKHYANVFNQIIKNNYSDRYSCVFYGLNFENNEISIGFQNGDYEYKEIVFAKSNGDLYLKSSETTLYGEKIFKLLGNKISEAYDDLMNFKDFEVQRVYWRKSINSNFKICICKYGVSLSNTSHAFSDFELNNYNFNDNYDIKCNSLNVINAITGHEDEIFKKIFIEINDCPNWMKKQLYNIRKEQISNLIKAKEEKTTINKKTEESIRSDEDIRKDKKFKQKIFSLFKK